MITLNYKHFGSGPPLIILHGLLGSSDNWLTIGKKIAEHFSVYLVDQRNHGRSPHTEAHSFELMARDLLQFMQQHHIERAHLIGHSMGGKTAMQFAILHPEKIWKQIIVDIAPKKYQRAHDEIFDALFSLNLSQIEKREEADALLALKIPDSAVRQFLMKNLERHAISGKLQWKPNLNLLYRHYEDLTKEITAHQTVDIETLVIRGARSDYVHDKDLDLFKKIFPKTIMVTVNHAGHWVHADAPEAFIEIVEKFLRS